MDVPLTLPHKPEHVCRDIIPCTKAEPPARIAKAETKSQMLLLIDNYDSFTYNLVHYLGELGAEMEVHRNDALDVQEAMAMKPAGILLSPGPCDPDQGRNLSGVDRSCS